VSPLLDDGPVLMTGKEPATGRVPGYNKRGEPPAGQIPEEKQMQWAAEEAAKETV
jgi:hypothetical protein